jgi:hypothetical protein
MAAIKTYAVLENDNNSNRNDSIFLLCIQILA